MQQHELGRGRRHEGQQHDGGGHARPGIDFQRVDNAGGDGAQNDHAREDGRQNNAQRDAAEKKAPQQSGKASPGELEATQREAAGKAGSVHGLTDDDRREGKPGQYCRPWAEHHFRRGDLPEQIRETEQRGHADGRKYVEGPGQHGHAGHADKERKLGGNVNRRAEIKNDGQKQGHRPAKQGKVFHGVLSRIISHQSFFVLKILPESGEARLRRDASSSPVPPQFTCGIKLRWRREPAGRSTGS